MFARLDKQNRTEYSIHLIFHPDCCVIGANINLIVSEFIRDYRVEYIEAYQSFLEYPYDDKHNKISPDIIRQAKVYADRATEIRNHMEQAVDKNKALFGVIYKYLEKDGLLNHNTTLSCNNVPSEIAIVNRNYSTNNPIMDECNFHSYLKGLFEEMLNDNVITRALLEGSNIPFSIESAMKLRT